MMIASENLSVRPFICLSVYLSLGDTVLSELYLAQLNCHNSISGLA